MNRKRDGRERPPMRLAVVWRVCHPQTLCFAKPRYEICVWMLLEEERTRFRENDKNVGLAVIAARMRKTQISTNIGRMQSLFASPLWSVGFCSGQPPFARAALPPPVLIILLHACKLRVRSADWGLEGLHWFIDSQPNPKKGYHLEDRPVEFNTPLNHMNKT